MRRIALPFLIGACMFLLGCKSMQAQFIHFSMDVEPELSISVIQDLNFGNVISNSGVTRIEKGSAGMGVFEIRGLSSQLLVATLDPPSHLTHASDEIDAQMPISLEFSYNNTGEQNEGAEQSNPFPENNVARFTLGGPRNTTGRSTWQSAFIYIYGNMEVGEIPEGVYEGTITLLVEYQ